MTTKRDSLHLAAEAEKSDGEADASKKPRLEETSEGEKTETPLVEKQSAVDEAPCGLIDGGDSGGASQSEEGVALKCRAEDKEEEEDQRSAGDRDGGEEGEKEKGAGGGGGERGGAGGGEEKAESDSGKSSSRSARGQVLVGLRETDVGIVEYLSDHVGISGILKQRYRDFLVNEINKAGQIVHLTDVSCPEKKSILPFDHNEVLSTEDQEKLSTLNTGQDKKAECLLEVTDDKDQRTKIHQAIRHLFPKLESTTVEVEGKRKIKVTKGGGGKRARGRWPKDTPNYCNFVLHKENMDINEALAIISKYLHIGPHHFQYAGSKDKRGVTAQEVTVHRVDGERLSQLNKVLRCIRLGNFRYVHKPLSLGDLSGNHFVIVLRNVTACEADIDTAMTSLKEVGFINYFGMQRFGNSLISTYHVGRALLLGQWQTAVDLILKPREGAQEDNRWREHWMKTRDPQGTLALLPYHKKSSVEMQLLRGLLKTKNDYLASFSSIPRNTRLIYIHSYQSYIWNSVTTLRLQKHGLSPSVGDLVSRDIKDENTDEELALPRVTHVTEENADQFTIYDVVLPLPGHGVQFPTNQAGEWYREKLAQDGITIEMLKNPIRDLSLFGAYRKCIVKPTDVDWEMYHYEDFKIPLIPTDLEKLENANTPLPVSEGSQTALKVEFSLPSSCYATMALREVMKTDTSAVHQSSLNSSRHSK